MVILVDKSKELLNLHKSISNAIDPYIIINPQFERENFKPHLSILYSVPDNMHDKAVEYAKKQLIPVKFQLNNINLIRDIPNITKEREFVKKYYF